MALPAPLAEHPIVRKLQQFHPDALQDASEGCGQLALLIAPALLHPVCEFLGRDPELALDFLADLTAVDRFPVEPRFELVYQLRSTKTTARLRLKARVPGDNPRIDSLVGHWPGADMLECEVFDLFGVHFNGHPNLRRLLLPDDWEGHPLRKDYPVEGYR